MQTDEPVAACAGRAVGRAGSWGRIPRTYLPFGKDRTIATAFQDRMIAEADALTPGIKFRVHDFPGASGRRRLSRLPALQRRSALPFTASEPVVQELDQHRLRTYQPLAFLRRKGCEGIDQNPLPRDVNHVPRVNPAS
ncbi:hypothetical protein [Streptomyces sp. TLI_55]|uniref:hypothetical protein n=1 Tax=Streptomyces sp. TLI_55 TaxID=1938861 RepID=UPI00211C4868|nr:hypothetical protein [Streptomyces sp. TLI_55]